MNDRHPVLYLLLVLVACSPPSVDRLIEPDEIIVGRARDGESVWLLTDTKRLVRFSVEHGTSSAVRVSGVGGEEELWGLARVGEGPLWSLLGSSTAVVIDMDGTVKRRLSLRRQAIGMYGAPGGLLVQPVTATGGRQALEWMETPEGSGRPVGSLEIVEFGTRAETLARNLVGCGLSPTAELPCWFNHEARVHRVGPDGVGAIVELGPGPQTAAGKRERSLEDPRGLEGRASAQPMEELDGLDAPGPVIDAQIAMDGSLWVVLRADFEESGTLARYAPEGVKTHDVGLDRPVRCILDIDGKRARLLSRRGDSIEVSLR